MASWSVLSDEELVAACRRRETAAWAELVTRYERLVWRIARKHGLSREASEEVFEGAFAELWRSLPQLALGDGLRAWLITVTQRRSLAQARQQRRWSERRHSPAAEMLPAGDALMLDSEQEETMRRALEQMPARGRHLLEWLYLSDPPPPYAIIGRRLGIAATSTGLIRGRWLRKLRRAWERTRAAH